MACIHDPEDLANTSETPLWGTTEDVVGFTTPRRFQETQRLNLANNTYLLRL